jgi:dTDP-4-amino-4,6-dideoxygalactose transaminase
LGRDALNVRFLDLSRAHVELRGELMQAIEEVGDSGHFVLGPTVEAFEEAFAAYCGAAHVIGVASGTDALALALRAVGIQSGDEAITAANTCVPTVAAIEAAGARPVLINPDPETCTLDPGELSGALTERTAAIVPVHLYGQCADMDPILNFARAHGLKVVEDAAQAHGAEYHCRRAGTLGDAAAFSFYPTKNLGALGDGGAIVTDDPGVAERARLLRHFGERERNNSIVRHGTTSRLDSLQAAALSVKLVHLGRWNERRRELAALYGSVLGDTDLKGPTEAPGRRHVYHLFVVRVPNRDVFRAALQERGIETLVHYPRAIHQHLAYGGLTATNGRLGISERLASEVVSLPLYPQLTDAEADAVADAVRAAAANPTAPA